MVMNEEKIGDRLRRLRTEVKLSQRELAKRSGVDREYINQIEANKTKSMTLRIAVALAKGMGVSPSRFFNGAHSEETEEMIERLIEHIRKFK